MGKAKNEHQNENISTRESLPGVPGVGIQVSEIAQKYDFFGLEVSLEALTG